MLKKLALTAFLSVTAAFANAETYALCIGINDYITPAGKEGTKDDPDLKGCVNDARSYKKVFVEKYGVKESNVHLLLDKDANVDKFLAEMKWLVQTAKPGDQIVFTYSGHGGQVDDKTEADGKEEVICLADDNLVPGDLFGDLAKSIADKGVHSTWIFDSCFSGGMSRDASGKITIRNKSRGVVKPKSPTAILNATVGFKKATTLSKGAPQATKGESLFMFASKEDKPSSDVSGLEGIDPHGIFTLLLTAAIEDAPQSAVKDLYTLLDGILESINKTLKDKGSDVQFTQGPNFETSASRANSPILLKG